MCHMSEHKDTHESWSSLVICFSSNAVDQAFVGDHRMPMDPQGKFLCLAPFHLTVRKQQELVIVPSNQSTPITCTWIIRKTNELCRLRQTMKKDCEMGSKLK